MRILIVTNLYPNPFQPGRSTFNRQQFGALAAGHSVAVISPIAWTDELRLRWNGAGALPAGRRVECDGIVVDHPVYVFPPRVMRGWYGHFFRRSIRRTFDRAVAEFRPDVVLGSWAYPDGWAAVTLARRAGLPVVLKVHGSDVLTLGGQPSKQGPTGDALRQADGVVAVSRDLSAAVQRFGVDRNRVRVIYNGVDTSLFCPGDAAEARARVGIEGNGAVLVYIGNLVPVKGVDVLVEACGELARAGTVFTCYMIGQGALRGLLERRIAELGLQEKVKLAGPKPHKQLPDWFRAAELFVLPSRSEGVPNVLLEASACGTPYVASRVGGIPEIAHLGDGRLVAPTDATALAATIRERLAEPTAAKRFGGARLRSHAEAAAELILFLEEAVVNHRRAKPHAA